MITNDTPASYAGPVRLAVCQNTGCVRYIATHDLPNCKRGYCPGCDAYTRWSW